MGVVVAAVPMGAGVPAIGVKAVADAGGESLPPQAVTTSTAAKTELNTENLLDINIPIAVKK